MASIPKDNHTALKVANAMMPLRRKLRNRSLLPYAIKDFLGMLAAWQIDHSFSRFFWNVTEPLEIARIFTFKLYMAYQDFWILCLFAFLLAVYFPELVFAAKSIMRLVSCKQAAPPSPNIK